MCIVMGNIMSVVRTKVGRTTITRIEVIRRIVAIKRTRLTQCIVATKRIRLAQRIVAVAIKHIRLLVEVVGGQSVFQRLSTLFFPRLSLMERTRYIYLKILRGRILFNIRRRSSQLLSSLGERTQF